MSRVSRLIARAAVLVFVLLSSETVLSAEIVAAAKSDWIYYDPYHEPQISAPCFASDQATANDVVDRAQSSSYCTANFSSWVSQWPNGEGRTDWRQLCPAPGIPITWGYQRKETRTFEYTYTTFCGSPQYTTQWGIERQRFYYCADSTNYEIFQPPYQPGPMIPACRLKANRVEPKKQPRQGDDCCKVGNPINIATGAKYQREVDYVGAGAFPLGFERHYWGGAWTHSYSRNIFLDDINGANYHVAVARRDDGQELTFKLESGAYVSSADVNAKLERLSRIPRNAR